MLILIEFTLLLNEITMIIVYYLLIQKNKNELSGKKDNQKAKMRQHTIVKTSNYDNSYGNRGYSIYKNKNGLYEPQTPHKGIDLKKED